MIANINLLHLQTVFSVLLVLSVIELKARITLQQSQSGMRYHLRIVKQKISVGVAHWATPETQKKQAQIFHS